MGKWGIYMKKFFEALGKAILYFLVFFGVELGVCFVMVLIYLVKFVLELEPEAGTMDNTILAENFMAKISDLGMLATLVSGIAVLLVYWLIFRIRKKNFFEEVNITKIPAKAVFPIVLFGFSFNIFLGTLLTYLPFPQSWIVSLTDEINSIVLSDSPSAWIGCIIVGPIMEEVVFRGLIYTRLRRGMPVAVAAVVASLFFAVGHLHILWILDAFVMGMLCVLIYERYHSLTANIIFHMSANAVSMVLPLLGMESELSTFILFVISSVVAVGTFLWMLKQTKSISGIE